MVNPGICPDDRRKGNSEDMKSTRAVFRYHPFEQLKDRLKKRSFEVARSPANGPETRTNIEGDCKDEEMLFLEAMEGVTPISEDGRIEKSLGVNRETESPRDSDAEILSRLTDLVERGEGFIIADTPEYVEGTGYAVNRQMVNRLHRGEFSIQGYIDLHGLNVGDAKEVFGRFLKESITKGKNAVLIVHGRGLSSPVKPVLKEKVVEWLTRGPWRKWVIAFSSARSCDGGAGATYVLLRRRPLTKRHRKRKNTGTEHKKIVFDQAGG